MSTSESGTLTGAQGLLARAAPGGRAVLAMLALLGPGAAATLVALDARTAGSVDPALAAAGGAFAAAAVATGWLAVKRLRGLAAVADAVRAASVHQTGVGELRLDPGLGPAAEAWNALVDRQNLGSTGSSPSLADATGGLDGALMDAMPDGLFILDRRGGIVSVNGAGRVLLGVERDGVVDPELLHGFVGEQASETIRDCIAGKLPRRRETERTTTGDQPQIVRIGIAPIEGATRLTLVSIEDVTRQRSAEASRGEFLAQATHELRAPLTNIRLYVDMAIDEGDENPEVRTEALNVVANESQRLERIVSDLLNISELESGARTAHRGDVRIEQMLEDIRKVYERPAMDKKIGLSFELAPQLPVLKGDRDHVAMLIQNLVGNAIKYTPEGGSVTVRAGAENGQFVLDVVDTGIGIAPDEAQLVFEKFYRSRDQRIEGITGSGLGLAFAREVARQHGGDLAIDSELNRGSTFTLRLPAGRAA